MSDNVRNHTEITVKNDTVATDFETVEWTPFNDVIERQPLRQVDFAKPNDNNSLTMPSDNTTTTLDSGCRKGAHRDSGTTPTSPVGGLGASGSDALVVDWSTLSEKQFDAALQTVTSVEELSGVANRRRVLNQPNLPMWSEVQKSQILNRKFQLENKNG